jgi:hypothetical protein
MLSCIYEPIRDTRVTVDKCHRVSIGHIMAVTRVIRGDNLIAC